MLYTIGTSNRSFQEFAKPLISLGVRNAIDVRSRPYSRFAHFNKNRLELALSELNIRYIWMGRALGGYREEDISAAEIRCALGELVRVSADAPTVMFCSEGEPSNCHRTWDIGQTLITDFGLAPVNILRNDELEEMTATLGRCGVQVNAS